MSCLPQTTKIGARSRVAPRCGAQRSRRGKLAPRPAARRPSSINLLTANVKALLVDLADFSFNAAHNFLNDVSATARIAASGGLTGKAINDAAEFDSADPIFLSVAGDQLEAIILLIDTADESTSRLLMFQDTGVTGLPLTPKRQQRAGHRVAKGWFTL